MIEKSAVSSAKKSSTRSLTKFAFLAVAITLILGTTKNWMDSRRFQNNGTQFDGEVADQNGMPVDRAAQIFSDVLPQLFPGIFFGNATIDGTHTIVVAGFFGEQLQLEKNEGELIPVIKIFPYTYDKQKPFYMSLTNKDAEVVVIERDVQKTMSLSKIVSKFSVGRPVAITYTYSADDEFAYMNSVLDLERLNDHLKFGKEESPYKVILSSDNITNIRLF